MSRFHNPVTGTVVSVADEKDDRYPHWERVSEDWRPEEPPLTEAQVELMSEMQRAGAAHARRDAERAARIEAEEAADGRLRAEARERAAAELDEQRQVAAEKARLRRAEFERIAELNRQTREQAAR